MNPLVSNWLSEGKDYYTGVHLLRQLGEDTAYFDRYLSASVAPEYQQGRLKEALLAVIDKPQAITQQLRAASRPPTLASGAVSTPTFQQVQAEPLPIHALRDEAKRWHKIEADNHAQLHLATDQNTRFDLVKERRKTIRPSLDAIYGKIRHYHATGEVPNLVETPAETDPLSKTEKETLNDLWREKLSIEPRLSKIKKQLKYHTEITEKFDRLRVIHAALALPFDKKIAEYL